MKKVFNLGKIAYGSKRKVNLATVEVEYNETEKGPVFSAMGSIWNGSKTDILAGGQCLDELNNYLYDNELFKTIYGLWKRNHLNDCDACANDAQRKAVDEYYNAVRKCSYEEMCEYLSKKGLYEVEVNGKKCKYGQEWYYREISESDRKTIDKLMQM